MDLPAASLPASARLREGDQFMKLQETKARAAAQKYAKTLNDPKIEKAAQDFEAVFLSEMLQEMFADVGDGDLTGDSYAKDVYRSMLVDEYGKLLAKAGGIGIADHVKKELLTLQEVE